MEFKISNEYLELTVSSHGAEKQTLVSKQTNISYLRDIDQYWNRRAPLLFPIVGKLRDLKTFINNKEYSMNQHGFLRDQEFELYSQTENELVLVNKFNEETLKKYPFEYQVFVKYTLVEKTVYTEFIVQNLDYQVIPFNYGGHPGFKVPLYENETFNEWLDRVSNCDEEVKKLCKILLNIIFSVPADKTIYEGLIRLRDACEIPPYKAKLVNIDSNSVYSKLMYANSLLVYFEFEER